MICPVMMKTMSCNNTSKKKAPCTVNIDFGPIGKVEEQNLSRS